MELHPIDYLPKAAELSMNKLNTGTSYQLYVGVDISDATATVAWLKPGSKIARPFTIDQTSQGYAAFQQKIEAAGYDSTQVLVVMEATGNYWICLATTLVDAGFVVSVINPAQAHILPKHYLNELRLMPLMPRL